MKKGIFMLFCCFLSTVCTAQMVASDLTSNSNIAEIDTMKIMYVHVILTKNDDHYLGIADVGDGKSWAIINAKSKKLKAFKSPTQLFNFMYDNQWEYVDTIENVTSTGALGQLLFGVNIAKTKFVYVFKRRKS
jgi:hypothetical protein